MSLMMASQHEAVKATPSDQVDSVGRSVQDRMMASVQSKEFDPYNKSEHNFFLMAKESQPPSDPPEFTDFLKSKLEDMADETKMLKSRMMESKLTESKNGSQRLKTAREQIKSLKNNSII